MVSQHTFSGALPSWPHLCAGSALEASFLQQINASGLTLTPSLKAAPSRAFKATFASLQNDFCNAAVLGWNAAILADARGGEHCKLTNQFSSI